MQYQIGDFSRISGLSIKTLRYYHEYGLLEPTGIDHESGYRYYDEKCLERVNIINELKGLEFPLKEIREILADCRDDTELIQLAMEKSAEISAKVTHYHEMQKKLEAFIRQTKLAEETKMTNSNREIIIKEIPDILVASLRFKGRYPEIGPVFRKLFRYAGRNCNGAPFALYYDTDYREDGADIEACVPVRHFVADGNDIRCQTLKGGKALTVIDKGPFDNHGESYKLLIDHINESRLKIESPYREVYLKGPGLILPGNPKNFITEIQILLSRNIHP